MKKHDRSVPRRTFLKTACTAAGAAIALPHMIFSKALAAPTRPGANQRLTLGIIGLGERGNSHLTDMMVRMNKGEVNVAAICDVDSRRLEKASKIAGPQAAVYTDYRYILQRKDIDAVIIATPNHWHGVQFVHAAEWEKHIYCESPACSTIAEGKVMIETARRAKIVSQIGAQGRSQPEAYLMHRYLANGQIGKTTKVDCWCSPGLVDENPLADDDPPEELDWDLWLGPLHWRSYNPRFSNGVFRWMMESGGGQLFNRGAHVMSCAMYWLGADSTGPVTVEAGGTTPDKGLWDTPLDMNVTYTFENPNWVMSWNQPGDPVKPEERTEQEHEITESGFGAIYEGENGKAISWGGDDGVWVEDKVRQWTPESRDVDVYKSPGHMDDWFNGIKTGEKTIMNIEAGVGVANLCILGNLSFILGRKLKWDQTKCEIVDDEYAGRLMNRPQRFPYHM